MKKHLLFFFMLLLSGAVLAGEVDLDAIRNRFKGCIDSEKNARELYSHLKDLSSGGNETVRAYLGATKSLLAKHAVNPMAKLSYLKDGLNDLAYVIDKAPANGEFRYMRFFIETQIPSFLNLSNHVLEDKAVLVALLKKYPVNNYDRAAVIEMSKYLIGSGHCNDKEKKELEQILKNCQTQSKA